MRRPTRVIVTDTHTRMSLALVRELGTAGYEVISVVPEGAASLGGKSRFSSMEVVSNADLLQSLHEYQNTGAVLLPCGTAALNAVAEQHEAFSKAFAGLFSTDEARQKAADKVQTAQIAESLGLLVPQTYPINAPPFPCVLKYRNADALNVPPSGRYAIVSNPVEYAAALTDMSRAVQGFSGQAAEIFASEYVEGEAFGVSAVLDAKSKPCAVFAHKRVREYPITGGPACCAESIWERPLIESALALFRALGLCGLAMAEFKGSPAKPYFLEVNPRIWGTYPLTRLCHVGMAQAYMNCALSGENGFTLPEIAPYKVGQRMQFLPNDIAHFCDWLKLRRFKHEVLADMLSPSVRGGVFSFEDLRGSMRYVRNILHL